MIARTSAIERPVAALLGEERAASVLAAMEIEPALQEGGELTRAQVAMALNVVLFARLLERVPTARRYVEEAALEGRRIRFDHGALRTIDGPTGALPSGRAAFARLLEPLGYRVAGVYPLPRLRMTGYAYAHEDCAEGVPQFFVSELHVAQLPEPAQAAAARVFGTSVDPVSCEGTALLERLRTDGTCSADLAIPGIAELAGAFDRQHEPPSRADYEILRDASAEAAWIATEGNAFNHATDRVDDVVALAESLRARGYPLKAEVEHSANGRVHQTAFLADPVARAFRGAGGALEVHQVPGSFYEFITRDVDPATGRLDLGFDSGNATGIFAVTGTR